MQPADVGHNQHALITQVTYKKLPITFESNSWIVLHLNKIRQKGGHDLRLDIMTLNTC